MNNVLGVVMAGGRGSRLAPVTEVVNKHLLPVYQKPMIFYALSNLVLSGVSEIALITNRDDVIIFENLLKPLFEKSNCKLSILAQEKPNGIAEVFDIVSEVRGDRDLLLHLGDNLFFGHDFITRIKHAIAGEISVVFSYTVKDPSAFGVIKVDNNRVIEIIEKPKKFVSNEIVTGLYFYKSNDLELSNKLAFSNRGELEITQMNNLIIQESNLGFIRLERGDIWYDCGTFDDLASATQFIRFAEERHSVKIGNLTEILGVKG